MRQGNTNSGHLDLIRRWFDSPLGLRLIETEQAILDQVLPELFGYHLLQLGVADTELWQKSSIGHRFRMSITSDDPADIVAPADQLPFEKDSIDVVILHHLLDFYESPHPVLREAARVVIPSGYLVIVNFNPISPWGLWKMLPYVRKRPPANAARILSGRLMDWLTLLDFKIDRMVYGFHQIPLPGRKQFRLPDFSQGLSRRMNWPFGGLYVIVARKQVGAITPLRPVWSKTAMKPIPAMHATNRSFRRDRSR